MHLPRPALAALMALASASSLPGQEPDRLGVNLSVSASSQVGLTYHLTPSVALRPAISFGWRRMNSGPGVTTSFTDYGGSLDVLFMLSRGPAIRPYLGVGGTYILTRGGSGTAHTAAGWGLLGVRARILDRVHVYGEAALRYSAARSAVSGGIGTDQVVLSTTPLAVLIFFH